MKDGKVLARDGLPRRFDRRLIRIRAQPKIGRNRGSSHEGVSAVPQTLALKHRHLCISSTCLMQHTQPAPSMESARVERGSRNMPKRDEASKFEASCSINVAFLSHYRR
jgi:hypothetical protein